MRCAGRVTGYPRAMPEMDDGATDGPPGRRLHTVTVVLTRDEAFRLLESLRVWAEEIEEGHPDEGWHTHIDDDKGDELTVAIRL